MKQIYHYQNMSQEQLLSHTLYSSESFQPIITLLYELRSKIARLPIESSTNYTDELNELINRIEVK